MTLGLHFFLGFIASFLGTITPSMLNIMAINISLKKGKSEAVKYASGVSLIVLVQAYVAILFIKFLRNNPIFLAYLQQVAAIIFLFLSIYFYKQARKEKRQKKEVKEKTKNNFIVGLLFSALNMFAIPFYFGVATAFDVVGWLKFSQSNIIVFVIGSALGTFTLLSIYARYADKIESKLKGLSQNLNLILSVLTAVVAIVTFIKIM